MGDSLKNVGFSYVDDSHNYISVNSHPNPKQNILKAFWIDFPSFCPVLSATYFLNFVLKFLGNPF